MTTATAVARHLQKQHLWGETQLQKLVYYAQAWSLAWTGRPLFDDDIEAWTLGPVTPAVWYMSKHGEMEYPQSDLTDDEKAIVDAVYAFYGHIGGVALSQQTHVESPWKEAWRDGAGQNSTISHSAMRRAYVELSVREPERTPRAPVLTTTAPPAHFRAAVERQRNRWRPLLDRLADR